MTGPTPVVLLIADISGYTDFVRLHRVSLSHATETVTRLLRTLVRRSRPPLRVAELEGDAVFFYAPAWDGDLARAAAAVKRQIPELFRAFGKEVEALARVRSCPCDACCQAERLELKQVVHAGTVELERIGRFEKLFGLDVILVHRMLKNSVPARRYLMMTEEAYAAFGEFFGRRWEERSETFEGIGEVPTRVFYPEEIDAIPTDGSYDRSREHGRLGATAWKLLMQLRTLLRLYRTGDRKGRAVGRGASPGVPTAGGAAGGG